jgi:DNA-binding transcriptional ArsR family regulator
MSEQTIKPKAAKNEKPRLSWDLGTAYDFFISLSVLHDPIRYGLRASWAAGVRSRIPAAERKFLEEVQPIHSLPLPWLYTLPAPKDATSVLWSLRQIPVEKRMHTLMFCTECYPECDEHRHLEEVFLRVADRHRWDETDMQSFQEAMRKSEMKLTPKVLKTILDWCSRSEEFGERILPALQSYYQGFFAEEEKRIAPVLSDALARAQEQAEKLTLLDLLESLTQGLHFDQPFEDDEIILIPVFWSSPLVLFGMAGTGRQMMCYGARPANASLVPGEMVPEDLLRALKALADPTRLKIAHYLAFDDLTPADLARKLRLRPPTVIHHLNELRLAGLVHITLQEGGEKRYASRQEALANFYHNLQDFIHTGAEDRKPN